MKEVEMINACERASLLMGKVIAEIEALDEIDVMYADQALALLKEADDAIDRIQGDILVQGQRTRTLITAWVEPDDGSGDHGWIPVEPGPRLVRDDDEDGAPC